jgi:hypothetical protein
LPVFHNNHFQQWRNQLQEMSTAVRDQFNRLVPLAQNATRGNSIIHSLICDSFIFLYEVQDRGALCKGLKISGKTPLNQLRLFSIDPNDQWQTIKGPPMNEVKPTV